MGGDVANRIERYCDLNFAFLRECAGHIHYGHSDIVVVAEEIDGAGQVVRSWFLVLGEHGDGASHPTTVPAHTVVSTDIRPGEPTPPAIPGIQVRNLVGPEKLIQIRRERDERLANRQRHVIYSQAYLDAMQRGIDLQATVDQLQAQLAERDKELDERSGTISGYRNHVARLHVELRQSQCEIRKLRKQKTLLHRVSRRCKLIVKKLRASWTGA